MSGSGRARVCCLLGLCLCHGVESLSRLPLHLHEHSAGSLLAVSQPEGQEHFWSGKNGDNLRTGASKVHLELDISSGPAWSWHEDDLRDDLVRAAPLIDDQRNIYISSIKGSIYKMSEDGAVLWTYVGNESIPGVCMLMGSAIFASTDRGHVFALDMANGRELWRTKPAPWTAPDTYSITAAHGVVVVPMGTKAPGYNNRIVALNATDGRVKWTYDPDTVIYNFLSSVVDSALVFADKSGRTYRLDLDTGAEVWKYANTDLDDFSTGGAIVGPNHIVYVTSNIGNSGDVMSTLGRGRLTAFNLTTGELIWERFTDLQSNNAAAVGSTGPCGVGNLSVVIGIGENPDFPSDDDNRKEKRGRVVALNAITGEEQWSHDLLWAHGAAAGDTFSHLCLPDSFSNPVIDGDGQVFIGFEDGKLYRIKDSDCDGSISVAKGEVQTFDTGRAFQGSAAIAPGMLAAAPCNGLHVFK